MPWQGIARWGGCREEPQHKINKREVQKEENDRRRNLHEQATAAASMLLSSLPPSSYAQPQQRTKRSLCVLCVGRTTKENLGGKTESCVRKWNVYERWKPNRTRLTRRRDKAKSRANRSHGHRKLTPGALWRTPSVPLLLRNEFPEAPGTSVGGCTFLPEDYQA